ncbi:MAG: MogA/MoaB family molybdenum cofactor biosynthesis protein [Miltoncostaeaceae bacterium]
MSRARVAVVTVSDRSARGERADATGPALAEAIGRDGHEVVHREVVSDDEDGLAAALAALCDAAEAPDLVLTAGGTGLSPRDRAPEATSRIGERAVPGISEALRAASRGTFPHADLSRGVAVLRGRTLVVNLPGSVGGATDGWARLSPVVDHAADQLRRGGDDHPPGPGGVPEPLR